MKDVLKLVHDKMNNILNEYDYKSLPSDPNQKRWETLLSGQEIQW